MGWTLPQIRDIEADEFNALCDWAKRRAEKDADDDSLDMDEVLEARAKANERGDD